MAVDTPRRRRRADGILDVASLQGLHYLLWDRRLAGDTVRLVQYALAAELRLDQPAMSRQISRLEREGRIAKLSWQLYQIADPADWTD